MDIEIDIKCRHCGYIYRDSFRAMPHGKTLKCPLCCSVELQIKGDVLIEEHAVMDAFEILLENNMAMSKFKF